MQVSHYTTISPSVTLIFPLTFSMTSLASFTTTTTSLTSPTFSSVPASQTPSPQSSSSSNDLSGAAIDSQVICHYYGVDIYFCLHVIEIAFIKGVLMASLAE
jgi:hypothetical protein